MCPEVDSTSESEY